MAAFPEPMDLYRHRLATIVRELDREFSSASSESPLGKGDVGAAAKLLSRLPKEEGDRRGAWRMDVVKSLG